MASTLGALQSKQAQLLMAPAIKAGWEISVAHGDGTVTRNGRQLQGVPWCRLRAKAGFGPERRFSTTVRDWQRERAEDEAAKQLIMALRKSKVKPLN